MLKISQIFSNNDKRTLLTYLQQIWSATKALQAKGVQISENMEHYSEGDSFLQAYAYKATISIDEDPFAKPIKLTISTKSIAIKNT